MHAEIKTVTDQAIIEVEREVIHLQLSVQEAHLIDTLLGNCPDSVYREFGIEDGHAVWAALNKALDYPHGLFVTIKRGGE